MPEPRFEGDDDAFAALILRYLDGATSPEEEELLRAELRSGPRRAVFVDLCRQRGMLAEALAKAGKARPARRRAVVRRKRGPWVLAAAAAVLVAAVPGYLLLPGRAPAGIARLERAEGRVLRAGAPVPAGSVLAAGDGLETDVKGRAVVAFDDGTRLDLGPGTRIRGLDAAGGKKLVVSQGTLGADVARQPAGEPMTIRTPEGEARILGTVLRLAVSGGTTRLEVEKGIVRLTRLSDRKSAEVGAGQFAVASADADPVARPIALARIAAMPPGSWLAAPGTSMSQVFPDPVRVPGIQGRMGPSAVVAAWSGGAFDARRNRLVLWGGGFTDYHGNELYAFDVDRLAWERLTEPNPAPNLNSDANADGTPNSRATYNGLAVLAHADRLFALGGAVAGNGFAVCTRPWLFDFAGKTWTRRSPAGQNPEAGMGAASAYDRGGRRLWWGDGSGLFSFDAEQDRWTRHAEDKFYYQTAAIDSKRGLLVVMGNGAVAAYDLKNPVRQAWKTTGGDAVVGSSNPGLDYDPVRDRLTAWAGGAVYTLDPETKVWTARQAPGAPARTPHGIFGRWRYVPAVDAFILVTAAGEDVRFWKP